MSGDLHCHTRLSDGTLSIDEIIALAKARGLDTIAVTDHDCLAGTVRAKIIGDRNGIKVIPGVELSAVNREDGREVHILCYLPDFPDRLEGLCHSSTAARKRASQYMMIKAAQRFGIGGEIIKRCATGSTCLYKQHIMHALVECGLADGLYGKIYQELFVNEGERNIFVKPAYPDVFEVIEAVHAAGGIAVLAHPKLYDSFELLDRLVLSGLDGVEVWHPTADEETVQYLLAFAKKHKLLTTGGSDFHGLYNRNGVTLGDYCTPEQQISELLGYKAKIRRRQKKAQLVQNG